MSLQQHPVLRTARTGQARLHLAQVELDHPGVLGIGRTRFAPEALQAAVGLHAGTGLVGPSRLAQVAKGLAVHREEAAGGPVLGRHVGHGRPVGKAEALGSRPEVLHEAPHHTHSPQELGDGEHQVGGGGPSRAARPLSRTPTTCGTSMKYGWPSMTASASMPPTPQPSTPRPLIMVVWESVPITVSGKAQGRPAAPASGARAPARRRASRTAAPVAPRRHHLGQVLQVHLMADARPRRHHAQVAGTPPAPSAAARSARRCVPSPAPC